MAVWSCGETSMELNTAFFVPTYNPSRLMLERLEAGEWETPAEVPRELIISSLERQAEVETGTIELWAREDDSMIWKVVTERDRIGR